MKEYFSDCFQIPGLQRDQSGHAGHSLKSRYRPAKSGTLGKYVYALRVEIKRLFLITLNSYKPTIHHSM